jgi:hypothetical protein
LEVLEGPRGRPNLIYLVDDDVDDGLDLKYHWREQGEDSLWAEILDGYDYEVFDTGSSFQNKVPPERIGLATTVIWAVDEDIGDNTQLLRVCSEYGNFLHSYVKVGGNLIIIGRNPVYAHAYWPDGTGPVPYQRKYFSYLDFTPGVCELDGTPYYNFNWEVFGIQAMKLGDVFFSTIWPCAAGWDTVNTRTIPDYPGWDGVFDSAFFVTKVRNDIAVKKLYGIVPLDTYGQRGIPDCSRLLGVYVPGDDTRGHSAYIGFPPWLCNHDNAKTVIRKLLESFGQQPSHL